MRVTLLGHATVLVELDGANILMDPVLQDAFEDGAVTSCPKRMVRADKLPPLIAIIISHVHLDHFDIPSLAQLPRDVHVELCDRSGVPRWTAALPDSVHQG
jgi:L-ascorbate metabolism protein UlaG (beta-lactamase superfamily)